jgi:hypothetical protein
MDHGARSLAEPAAAHGAPRVAPREVGAQGGDAPIALSDARRDRASDFVANIQSAIPFSAAAARRRIRLRNIPLLPLLSPDEVHAPSSGADVRPRDTGAGLSARKGGPRESERRGAGVREAAAGGGRARGSQPRRAGRRAESHARGALTARARE